MKGWVLCGLCGGGVDRWERERGNGRKGLRERGKGVDGRFGEGHNKRGKMDDDHPRWGVGSDVGSSVTNISLRSIITSVYSNETLVKLTPFGI